MKTFFSLFLSFICTITIVQAQSLSSNAPLNPAIDYFDIAMDCAETENEMVATVETLENTSAAELVGCACLGDINRDGSLNLLDVEPFTDAIANGFNDPCADMNGDGSVDLLDVAPFIYKLKNGGCGGGS